MKLMYFSMNAFVHSSNKSAREPSRNKNVITEQNNNAPNNNKSQQSGGPVAPPSHVLLLVLKSLFS